MENASDHRALGCFHIEDDMATELDAAPAGGDLVTGAAEAWLRLKAGTKGFEIGYVLFGLRLAPGVGSMVCDISQIIARRLRILNF